MGEFPSQQSNIGGCLTKLIAFVLTMGLLAILLLGIAAGIVLAHNGLFM